MSDRAEARGGFTVLDGVALVMGAAVAAVHVKSAVPDPTGPGDWSWFSALFTWLWLTAAGPFLYLVRRFGTRPPGYPRLGDRLWALAGLPWCVAALIRTGDVGPEGLPGRLDAPYVACLTIGLALAMLIIVPTLAARYLLTAPDGPKPPEPAPWTHRLGLALTIAWPIQCGVGLVVMS